MKMFPRFVLESEFARDEEFSIRRPGICSGGGPSPEQRAAAASQATLNTKLGNQADQNQASVNENMAAIKPYAMSRLNNGLPFFPALTDNLNGVLARSYQPARAANERRLASFGNLPSGFAEQSRRDLDTSQARDYDSQLVQNLLMNEQSKSDASRVLTNQAQVLNPLGYFSGAQQGNNTILQAPLQRPGLAGLLGGFAGGAAKAFAGSLIMGSGISEATGSFRDLFGKRDASATNDVSGGKVVATGTPGAKTVTDPNSGLSDAQMRNRKFAELGLSGLGSMGKSSTPQRGSGAQIMMPQSPELLPEQQSYLSQYIRRPFFGGL
jgi:hypothetical protein